MDIFKTIAIYLNPYQRYFFFLFLIFSFTGFPLFAALSFTLLVSSQVYEMRFYEKYESFAFNAIILGLVWGRLLLFHFLEDYVIRRGSDRIHIEG
jgi:hypothetical protein